MKSSRVCGFLDFKNFWASDPAGRRLSGFASWNCRELGLANMDVTGTIMDVLRSFLWSKYWAEDIQTVRCSPGFLHMRWRRPSRVVQAFLLSRCEMSAVGGGSGRGKLENLLQESDWNGGCRGCCRASTFGGILLGSWRPRDAFSVERRDLLTMCSGLEKCRVPMRASLPNSYGFTPHDWNVRPRLTTKRSCPVLVLILK